MKALIRFSGINAGISMARLVLDKFSHEETLHGRWVLVTTRRYLDNRSTDDARNRMNRQAKATQWGKAKQNALFPNDIQSPTFFHQTLTSIVLFTTMFAMLKRNLFPALAVVIMPCGYYIGVQLRENKDGKQLSLQESEEDRQARLQKQMEALMEERQLVLSKIEQAKEEQQQQQQIR
ncbi:hypothetical protein EC973_001022 [Apophysomyces ossiformis]|uniref:Uncharacterized protein n=1 Tax=Apophysomyces ossiformis TaxID=679940 RepID=A0A8H7BWT8_9FUNG|nr:hypothetical protein EC973_001022 [Apophysomyces ossiformis]